MKFSAISLISCAALVLADAYTLSAVKSIDAAACDFNNTLASWEGSWLGILTILKKASDLKTALDTACNPPEGTALTLEAAEVQQQLQAGEVLVKHVGETIDTAIFKKELVAQKVQGLGVPLGRSLMETYQTALSGCFQIVSAPAGGDLLRAQEGHLTAVGEHVARGIAAYK